MALAMEVGLSPGDFRVRWGPSPHPPQKGGGAHLPKFPPISIAVKGLDTSRCHLVWRYPSSLWTLCSMRTQPPPEKGGGPMFGPCLLRPNCCMDHDATWYGGRPQPRRLCVRWGPSSPPQKGEELPSPVFGPCPLWPNGWMDQNGTWHGGGPWSTPHCAR